MFSLYSFLSGHISLWERHSLCLWTSVVFFFFFFLSSPRSPAPLLLSTLPSLSFPFSQPLTIELFMWPHFETWCGGLEGARGDTEEGGGGEMEGVGGGFPLFSSPQFFHEGRNIIFSNQASPRRDPRAELRRLKCQSPWPPPPDLLHLLLLTLHSSRTCPSTFTHAFGINVYNIQPFKNSHL